MAVAGQPVAHTHFAFGGRDADIKAGSQNGSIGNRGGINILHTLRAEERLLHRPGDAPLHFGGGKAGCLDEDVHQRHVDLRLLLPRSKQEGEDAASQRQRHDQGGQPGAEPVI